MALHRELCFPRTDCQQAVTVKTPRTTGLLHHISLRLRCRLHCICQEQMEWAVRITGTIILTPRACQRPKSVEFICEQLCFILHLGLVYSTSRSRYSSLDILMSGMRADLGLVTEDDHLYHQWMAINSLQSWLWRALDDEDRMTLIDGNKVRQHHFERR